jgi:outer membrane protein assembly factor BamD (BamD/ComL family)
MKFAPLLVLIMFLGSCDSSTDVTNLKTENLALQEKVASMEAEIAELKKTPNDLLNDVKNDIRNGEIRKAKENLGKIAASQLTSRQVDNINKLLSAVNSKLEQKDYQNLSESDTSLYRDFINNYPKSRYVSGVRKKLNRLRHVQSVSSNYPDNTRSYRKKRYSNYGTTRVGAICCDGTRSYATGRGACSHHGGVCQWLYQ